MKAVFTARAQRLVEEFQKGADLKPGQIRHGIAAVLRHIADTEGDEESWYAVPASTLQRLADELTAPTLLDRAMAGDRAAARRFLHEAGLTDADGHLLPHFRSPEEGPQAAANREYPAPSSDGGGA